MVSKPEHEERCRAMGIADFRKIYTSKDLASGSNIIFAATGVTDGDVLRIVVASTVTRCPAVPVAGTQATTTAATRRCTALAAHRAGYTLATAMRARRRSSSTDAQIEDSNRIRSGSVSKNTVIGSTPGSATARQTTRK